MSPTLSPSVNDEFKNTRWFMMIRISGRFLFFKKSEKWNMIYQKKCKIGIWVWILNTYLSGVVTLPQNLSNNKDVTPTSLHTDRSPGGLFSPLQQNLDLANSVHQEQHSISAISTYLHVSAVVREIIYQNKTNTSSLETFHEQRLPIWILLWMWITADKISPFISKAKNCHKSQIEHNKSSCVSGNTIRTSLWLFSKNTNYQAQ